MKLLELKKLLEPHNCCVLGSSHETVGAEEVAGADAA